MIPVASVDSRLECPAVLCFSKVPLRRPVSSYVESSICRLPSAASRSSASKDAIDFL